MHHVGAGYWPAPRKRVSVTGAGRVPGPYAHNKIDFPVSTPKKLQKYSRLTYTTSSTCPPKKSVPAPNLTTRPPIPSREGHGGALARDFLLPVNIRMEVLCGLAGQKGRPFSVLTHFLAIYYILEVHKRSICAKDYLYGQEGDHNAD